MSMANDDDEAGRDADRQATAMKDQLRKDVASWSATRSETSARQAADLTPPAVKTPAPRAAPRPKQPKAAPPAIHAVPAAKKPFSMSYDGVTTSEHIKYLLSRGTK